MPGRRSSNRQRGIRWAKRVTRSSRFLLMFPPNSLPQPGKKERSVFGEKAKQSQSGTAHHATLFPVKGADPVVVI